LIFGKIRVLPERKLNMNVNDLYASIDKHLTADEKPSVFLNEVYDTPEFKQYPFDMLHKLRATEQSPEHHPEGNVWNHTMLVVDEAAKVKDKSKKKRVFMWAALLHDIGKPATFRIKGAGLPLTARQGGGDACAGILAYFSEDETFIREVTQLVRYHMHMLLCCKGPAVCGHSGDETGYRHQRTRITQPLRQAGRTNADKKTGRSCNKAFFTKMLLTVFINTFAVLNKFTHNMNHT
jgi:putative nucleotidyltransferase with HDIG domain